MYCNGTLVNVSSLAEQTYIVNLTVNDIDFAKSKIIVQPKPESDYTWRWVVKDKERRELPLVESVAQLLANVQADLPEKQPYLLHPF